jgi:HSP20 family protein
MANTTIRNDQSRRTGREGEPGATGGERQTGLQSGREPMSSRVRGRSGTGYGIREPLLWAPYSTSSAPLNTMRRVMDDMDRIFEGMGFGRSPLLGRQPGAATAPAEGSSWAPLARELDTAWTPALEILERENNLVVRADLPGLRREDIEVDLSDDLLTISGERKKEQTENREGFYRSERSYGRFARTLALPEGVAAEGVEATFKDGVLEVVIPMPKRTENRRRVEIK